MADIMDNMYQPNPSPNFSRVKILVIVAVLVLAGFFVLTLMHKNGGAPQQAQQNPAGIVAGIFQSGSFADCARLNHAVVSGVDYQTVCQNQIASRQALSSLDVSWCNKLDNNLVSISSCQLQILSKKAIADKNPAVCSSVADSAVVKSCQDSYQLANPSLSDCDTLSDPAKKTACQNNYSLFQLVNNPNSAQCNFSSSALNADCGVFKNLLVSRTLSTSGCAALKTPEIYNFCILINRGR